MNRPLRENDRLRAQVAQEAARIVAEQGIEDFRQAKIKAAERLGLSRKAALPTNREIEAALKAHHSLFGGQQHVNQIDCLRQTAVAAMQLLDPYSPRLVGPVLAGTAHSDSPVLLHVFSDNADDAYFFLASQNVESTWGERQYKLRREDSHRYPVLAFHFKGVALEVTVFPFDGLRQAPISPIDGKPMPRAAIHDVQALIEDSSA